MFNVLINAVGKKTNPENIEKLPGVNRWHEFYKEKCEGMIQKVARKILYGSGYK